MSVWLDWLTNWPSECLRLIEWHTVCLTDWLTDFACHLPFFSSPSNYSIDYHKYIFTTLNALTFQKLPYFLAAFAFVSGSLQYGIMRRDQATHLAFGQSPDVAVTVAIHILRFLSGVHVFYAVALFWTVPTCVMLMVGYSMIEYQGSNSRLRWQCLVSVYLISSRFLTFIRIKDRLMTTILSFPRPIRWEMLAPATGWRICDWLCTFQRF